MSAGGRLALVGLLIALAAGAALAQTAPSGRPIPPVPSLGPRPAAPGPVDPRTGLPTTAGDPRPRMPLPSDPRREPATGPSSPGGTLAPPAPAPAPSPVPRTGPPSPSPPAGRPITPSTVDPRTGLPR